MPIKVTGEFQTIPRVSTGIYSLDVAVGNPRTRELGMPLRTYYEIYGSPEMGKSSLAYYLAGTVAKDKTIALCDIEGLDMNYVVGALELSGFDGELHKIDNVYQKGRNKNKPVPHVVRVQEMIKKIIYDEETVVGILDSVGSFASKQETEGDLGDANMGKRAISIAQACRRLSGLADKKHNSTAIIVNHSHGAMGGRGHTTPGGDTMKYLAGVRIWIKVIEYLTNTDDEALGTVIEGRVEKLRYGGKGRKFLCVNLTTHGISADLSAMFDCFHYGLAERGATVKIGDKSIGYISQIFDQARKGNRTKFEPFHELLIDKRKEDDFTESEDEDVGQDLESV